MDIGTKEEPGRMLTAEELLKPAGGYILPIEEDPPADEGPIGGSGIPVDATDQ